MLSTASAGCLFEYLFWGYRNLLAGTRKCCCSWSVSFLLGLRRAT